MASPKSRCPGSGRSRWSQSRPRLPARARRFAPFLVGEHAGVDDVGQAAFEGAHGHHRGHAAGLARVVVGAAFGLVAELDDGHDVQDPVDPPVPGPRQPVAFLVAGGGVQGCGAVPGRELVPVGEAVDVTDVGEQPGGAGGADAVQLQQRGPACGHQGGELLLQRS